MFECSGVKVRLWCGTGCDGAENLRFFIPFGRWFFLYHSSSLGCMLSCFSHVQLFVTPWTIAHQAPLSMGFSKKECWNVLPFLLLAYLPDPRITPASPVLSADSFTTEPSWKPAVDHFTSFSSSLSAPTWILWLGCGIIVIIYCWLLST